MTGGRQVRTGTTPLPLPARSAALLSVLAFLLTLALPVSGPAFGRPGAGWEAAALVATALLLTLGARRLVVVPTRFAVAGPLTGPRAVRAPMLSRLRPAAPGRPEQPRAPANLR